MGICCLAQETQTPALCQPRGVGRAGDRREVHKGGIYVYLWLIHVEVWQETAKVCKAIIFQQKNNFKKILCLLIPPKKTYKWLINTWKDAQHSSLLEKCKLNPQRDSTSHQWKWPSENPHTMNAGERVEKRKPSCTVESANCYNHCGKQDKVSLKY